MANRRRARSRTARGRQASQLKVLPLSYDKRNAIIFSIGLLVIAIGYICMAQPPVDGFLSLTLAPILLVIGYVVILPVAMLLPKQDESESDDTPEEAD